MGKSAHILRQSSRGGPNPFGTCLYNAGVGLSLQVNVQRNVGKMTLEMSKAPGAVPVPGVGTAAYWTKAGPVVGAQFDALKNGVWLHL